MSGAVFGGGWWGWVGLTVRRKLIQQEGRDEIQRRLYFNVYIFSEARDNIICYNHLGHLVALVLTILL